MRGFIKHFITFLIVCMISLLSFMSCVFYSDLIFFRDLREIYVATAMTTLNHRYLAQTFISEEEIARIMELNTPVPTEVSDTTVIQTNPNITNEINILAITGDTFKGKMIIVHDPARIRLAVSKKLKQTGERLASMIASSNALGGINASGFKDPDGRGQGGLPIGIVIKDGLMIYNSHPKFIDIIGFNYDNILVLGRYKKDQIAALSLRDAVSFSPFLIINGVPQLPEGKGGTSYHPRTAIGQTQDGKVLLLVIDGRQLSSLGATQKNVQDIMLHFGAYNAASLDGGASSVMYFQGQRLNHPCSKYGERYLPTAFVIK